MARPYDRTRHYMRMGEFVKILGFEGETAFFKIAQVEVMAQNNTLFGDPVQGVGAAPHIGAPPVLADPDPVPYKFIEPVQELRLVQMRLSVYPVNEGLGLVPNDANILPNIGIETNSPASERRFGSDKRTNTQMNGIAINPQPGGREGGRIPANQIRRMSDQNEVFDIFIIHGYEPAFDIANQTSFTLGNGAGPLDFDWYLNAQGRKYILGKPQKDELRGLIKGSIPYRAITLGGISTVTMEA